LLRLVLIFLILPFIRVHHLSQQVSVHYYDEPAAIIRTPHWNYFQHFFHAQFGAIRKWHIGVVLWCRKELRPFCWSFPWASSLGGDFNVSFTEEQQREGAVEYNYRREPAWTEDGIGDPLTKRGEGIWGHISISDNGFSIFNSCRRS
jgi:hypothetical protein